MKEKAEGCTAEGSTFANLSKVAGVAQPGYGESLLARFRSGMTVSVGPSSMVHKEFRSGAASSYAKACGSSNLPPCAFFQRLTAIALNNENLFPINPNEAKKEELVKVPGIGPKTAEKIVAAQAEKKFGDLKELKKLGVITSRAQAFLEVDGKRQSRLGSF